MKSDYIRKHFGKYFEPSELQKDLKHGATSEVIKSKVKVPPVVDDFKKVTLKAGDVMAIKSQIHTNASSTARAKREALILGELSKTGNKNVVSYYGFLTSPAEHFPLLLLEWSEKSVANLRDESRLDAKTIDTIIESTCSGIMALHKLKFEDALGWAHRDIKPENVLVFPNGVYKVCDFGSVGQFYKYTSLGGTGTTVTRHGTRPYVAPECFNLDDEKNRYGERSDIYSIGVMAFYLFAGRTPFDDIDRVSELVEKKKNLGFINASLDILKRQGIPESKISAIRRAIEPEAKNRHSSVDEFLREWKAELTAEQKSMILALRSISDLLGKPLMDEPQVTLPETVVKIFGSYDAMRAYVARDQATKTYFDEATRLVRARALSDYERISQFAEKLSAMQLNYAQKVGIVRDLVVLCHAWNNDFAPFVEKSHHHDKRYGQYDVFAHPQHEYIRAADAEARK